MSDLISLLRWVVDLIRGRAQDEKADQIRLEHESWQWLERHLSYFEAQAQQVYSLILHNSAEKVPAEFPDEKYPFVEKISHFPLRDDNALRINFRRLEWKDRQKAWAISKKYVEMWDSCIGRFPNGAPVLPYDMVKFEKTQKVLKSIIIS